MCLLPQPAGLGSSLQATINRNPKVVGPLVTWSPWCLWRLSFALALVSAICPVPVANAQGNVQPSPPGTEQDFTLSMNVDLVELHATVCDRRGRFVPDLTQSSFMVMEEGIKQEIRVFQSEEVPVTVGLVIDHSRSMRNKLPHVLAAARTFVAASKSHDQLFVVNFNEHATLGLEADTSFSNSVEQLEAAILSAPLAGQTALYDAISLGLEHLRQGKPDKKVLIVISDGGDNVSKVSLNEVLRRAGQSSALIYTIGIFDETAADRNPRALRRIAAATGGISFVPEEIDSVVAICGQIAREIRNQYTIGFFSNAASTPGSQRRVRVTATSPAHRGLSVRTRESYVTAGEQPHPARTPPQ